MPFFGANLRRPLTVDVARTLPAEPGRADPAAQCAGTDRNALSAQMCGQQRHGPGIGVIAELAWSLVRSWRSFLSVRTGAVRGRPDRLPSASADGACSAR